MTHNSESRSMPIVLQTDFGTKDGAVCAMRGVAYNIDPDLKIFDNTHRIPAYNIWEGAIRLLQVADCWESNTVFVSVVDPGVGSNRKSVVLRTKNDLYFVTPDNGTLMFVAQKFGIKEIREIDEAVNRRANTELSYTFHGRDVYVYTAARLASHLINFEQIGKKLPAKVEQLSYTAPTVRNKQVNGCIWCLDIQFGNVWTNINRQVAKSLKLEHGKTFYIAITHNNRVVYEDKVIYVNSFSEVQEKSVLLYFNSIDTLSVAINTGNFAKAFNIASGYDWKVKVHA